MQRRVGVIPDVTAHRTRAASHAAKGEWAEALAAYEAGLALDPTHLALLRGAAEAWLALDEPAKAEALLTRAVELAPWDEANHRELQRARRAVAAAAH
jgi:tetratricopeptide (TPR) repeat protein